MTRLPRAQPGAGIVLHIAGLWMLSVLDASGKLLAGAGVSVLLLSWVRYTVHVALMTVLVLPARGATLWSTRSLARQLLRAVLMLGTTVLFFTTLRYAPLAEATAMNFIAPLLVMAAGPRLLGERRRPHRTLGVVAGFAGMLLVVRPGGALSGPGVVLGLATAMCFACFQVATRRVAHDDPLTSNYYGGLVGAGLLTLALPFAPPLPALAAEQWLLLLSTGASGFVGHWLQTAAYRRAPATLLAPFSYFQIVSAVTLGWLLFGQLPDALTGAGMTIICAAGAGVALYERTIDD